MNLKALGRWGLAAAVALGGLGGAVAPAAASSGTLQLLGTEALSPRLQELTFTTPALEGPTKVRVLLPSAYDASGRTRYPLLLLLHGAGEDQTAWTVKGNAERITAGYPLIVVMPDGGVDGGYQDWYNQGAYGPPAWETYHLGQLLPWIDAHYPTTGTRAVAGVSMGGGGAMHYAAAHPDLFAAGASFSGAVDNSNLYQQPLDDATGVADGKPPGSACGLWQTDEIRCRGVNPLDLAENLKGLFLQLDTGDGLPGGPNGNGYDPVENGVYQQSTSLHERLNQLGIPHVWDYYGPGNHDYYYFSRDLAQLLPRLMKTFADPPAPPRPFDFMSIAPAYSAYGWAVVIDRPAVEFSELRSAGPRGFQLRGSGSARVTTAPYYRPGAALRVELVNLEADTTRVLHADAAGRLSLPVTLGPGNPYQEYSPQANAWLATRHLTDDSGQALDGNGNWPVYTATVTVSSVPGAGPGVAPVRHGAPRRHHRRHRARRVHRRGHRRR